MTVRHLLVVATAFRLAGLTLAIGSILALADFTDTALVMHRMPPPENGRPLDIGTYGVIALLTDAARGLGWIVNALAGVADAILVVLAILAVLNLLLGVLLYFTGRGIARHARWARIVAVLISDGLALCLIVAVLLAGRQDLALLAAIPIGFCFYTLWALIWRFA